MSTFFPLSYLYYTSTAHIYFLEILFSSSTAPRKRLFCWHFCPFLPVTFSRHSLVSLSRLSSSLSVSPVFLMFQRVNNDGWYMGFRGRGHWVVTPGNSSLTEASARLSPLTLQWFTVLVPRKGCSPGQQDILTQEFTSVRVNSFRTAEFTTQSKTHIDPCL